MQDLIPHGTGNSRWSKTALPENTTWEEALALWRAGMLPVDNAGINPEGIAQEGTPLNKETLLSDETANKMANFNFPIEDPPYTPNEAFDAIIRRFTVATLYITAPEESLVSVEWNGNRINKHMGTGSPVAVEVGRSGDYTITASNEIDNAVATVTVNDNTPNVNISISFDTEPGTELITKTTSWTARNVKGKVHVMLFGSGGDGSAFTSAYGHKIGAGGGGGGMKTYEFDPEPDRSYPVTVGTGSSAPTSFDNKITANGGNAAFGRDGGSGGSGGGAAFEGNGVGTKTERGGNGGDAEYGGGGAAAANYTDFNMGGTTTKGGNGGEYGGGGGGSVDGGKGGAHGGDGGSGTNPGENGTNTIGKVFDFPGQGLGGIIGRYGAGGGGGYGGNGGAGGGYVGGGGGGYGGNGGAGAGGTQNIIGGGGGGGGYGGNGGNGATVVSINNEGSGGGGGGYGKSGNGGDGGGYDGGIAAGGGGGGNGSGGKGGPGIVVLTYQKYVIRTTYNS